MGPGNKCRDDIEIVVMAGVPTQLAEAKAFGLVHRHRVLKTEGIQMTLFGIPLTEILEFGKYLAPAAIVAGAILRFGRQALDRFYNREFDTWLVSSTSASAPDPNTGKRRLLLNNIGSPERFNDAVRGTRVRNAMDAAAKQCSWKDDVRRFLLMPPEDQALMLHVSRNALTKFWADGVVAYMAGKPVTEHDYYFSVTGSDAAANAKKFFRVVVITREDAEIFLSHPDDLWEFDERSHRIRLETCRVMARALLQSGNNSVTVDGKSHQIVQWFRAYERV
jgi:hypothetical protein